MNLLEKIDGYTVYTMNGVIDAKTVKRLLGEAAKTFPIPLQFIKYKIAKGEGLGNANTRELLEWFEEKFKGLLEKDVGEKT